MYIYIYTYYYTNMNMRFMVANDLIWLYRKRSFSNIPSCIFNVRRTPDSHQGWALHNLDRSDLGPVQKSCDYQLRLVIS